MRIAAVIDYGVGNLLSVKKGLEICGLKVYITDNPELILTASRVVLPGVGAFGSAMSALAERGLVPVIRGVADKGTPLLGICLGMQLLMDESEEFGFNQGLGLIPGRVIRIPTQTTEGLPQKIPHIGWNKLLFGNQNVAWRETILRDIRANDSVYFVHSFMAVPDIPKHCLASTEYGGHEITAVIGRGNIIGCQFHPEKSGEVGLKILRSFCGN